ncbi:hypothetical protein [Terricaulis sp.]|uniref:hypothetical protein n=1 Tax=Terricaulis sp. TaxID=2768686 RepID=UPI003784826A
MNAEASDGKSKHVILISLFVVMTLLTACIIGGLAYEWYTGSLAFHWTNLKDSHAAVISQLIFLFGAAWAAVLVPLLFGEQLQDVERAAKSARETCESIEKRMRAAADETREEFKKIIRLQTMAVGHLHKDQLAFLETPEERNEFIDTSVG